MADGKEKRQSFEVYQCPKCARKHHLTLDQALNVVYRQCGLCGVRMNFVEQVNPLPRKDRALSEIERRSWQNKMRRLKP